MNNIKKGGFNPLDPLLLGTNAASAMRQIKTYLRITMTDSLQQPDGLAF